VSDIIDRLLGIEKEARSIIARAEKDAVALLDDAREEARRTVAEGHKQARDEAARFRQCQSDELTRQRDDRLRQEQAKLPTPESVDSGKLRRAVEFVVRVVAYGMSTG